MKWLHIGLYQTTRDILNQRRNNMFRKIILRVMIITLAISLVFIVACGKKEQAKDTSTPPVKQSPTTIGAAKSATPTPQKPDLEKFVAVIEMKKGGRIVFEFYPKDAPGTVDNFIKLANKGFYNGLKFHRVIPGFMAQGGDPLGSGMGGPGWTIKDEFNSKKHLKGTVAMARTMEPNSAGSQFYICFEPQPSLDGKYTVFGQVIEGMDVVDGIQKDDIMSKVYIADKASLAKK
jgi:cyclophilin family peptidyl-prolyl cis-trans isomerase